MRSEKQKMLAGELYVADCPELAADNARASAWTDRFNAKIAMPAEERHAMLRELFASVGEGAFIRPPFHCDYGTNIKMGRNVYFNFNCVVLDVATVTFGDGVLVGPAVQIYTAAHPLDRQLRRSGLEYGKPIAIGDDVWIGGGAILCPGVTVGAGSVIGAGSVVTGDIPAGVLAVGNPCRIVRAL